MVSFPKYDSYKNSGVEWLGDIPEHWIIQRVKWIFQQMKRPIRKEDEIVTCFRDGQVTLRSNRRIEGFTNAIQEHGYQGIRKGDLVIHAMDAFAGAIGVSDSDGKSTPVYSACLSRGEFEVNNYFYAYLLRYMALSGFILSLAKGIRERSSDFRFKDFSELLLPIPPLSEQIQIAEYLDKKTSEIDQAISKKYRLIELLEEQKTIIINQAVTKGLNPNTPMKDSGIEWLGSIPEGWKILPLTKYILSQVDYRGKTPEKVAEGVFLVTAKNIKEGYINYEISKEFVKSSQYEAIMSRGKPQINDLLFTTEAPLGEVALVDRIDIALAQRIIKFRLNEKYLFPNFIRYSMLSFYFRNYLSREATGSTAEGIKASKLHKLKLIVPNLSEQQKIAEYLDIKTAEIEYLKEKTQQQIDKLTEFKQILIANAVTGKIKVV